MKSRWVLGPASLLVALVAILGWYAVSPPMRSASSAPVDSDPTRHANHERVPMLDSELARPADRVPVIDAASEAPLIVVQRSQEPTAHPVRSVIDVEMKYAGMDKAHLIAAFEALSPGHIAERDRLIAERWQLGIFDSQFVAAGENLPSPREADGTTPGFGFKAEPTEGGMIVKTTILDSITYPDFALLELEVNWLRSRIGPGYTPPESAK